MEILCFVVSTLWCFFTGWTMANDCRVSTPRAISYSAVLNNDALCCRSSHNERPYFIVVLVVNVVGATASPALADSEGCGTARRHVSHALLDAPVDIVKAAEKKKKKKATKQPQQQQDEKFATCPEKSWNFTFPGPARLRWWHPPRLASCCKNGTTTKTTPTGKRTWAMGATAPKSVLLAQNKAEKEDPCIWLG